MGPLRDRGTDGERQGRHRRWRETRVGRGRQIAAVEREQPTGVLVDNRGCPTKCLMVEIAAADHYDQIVLTGGLVDDSRDGHRARWAVGMPIIPERQVHRPRTMLRRQLHRLRNILLPDSIARKEALVVQDPDADHLAGWTERLLSVALDLLPGPPARLYGASGWSRSSCPWYQYGSPGSRFDDSAAPTTGLPAQ